MGKTMILWRANPNAPWPVDPVEGAKLNEMLWVGIDSMLKSGKMLEFGFFPDATSGYAITTEDPTGQYAGAFSMYPFIVSEIHEIVPYETGKEIGRGVFKATAEQMAAMKG